MIHASEQQQMKWKAPWKPAKSNSHFWDFETFEKEMKRALNNYTELKQSNKKTKLQITKTQQAIHWKNHIRLSDEPTNNDYNLSISSSEVIWEI